MISSPFSFHLPPSSLESNHSYHRKSYTLTSQILKIDHLLHNFNSPIELKQVHAHLIKTSTPLSILPVSRVAFVCGSTPCFPYAQQIFERVEKPEIVVWNSCLKAFAEGNSPVDAILLFYWMRQFDVIVDSFSCSFALKACVQLLDLRNGRTVHGFVEKLGFQSNLFLQNTILHLYASCGVMDDAVTLFENMSQRDVITWNKMITQLVKREDIDGAFDLFSRMPERNVRSWTSIIAGYVQCGKSKEAVQLFTQMEEAGERPNEVTVVAVLAACADLGALDLGRRIHQYSNGSGFRRNARICRLICMSNVDAWRMLEEFFTRWKNGQ